MSRIFNISFQHKGKNYAALVSILGADQGEVNIITTPDHIKLVLSGGVLYFSIQNLLDQIHSCAGNENDSGSITITSNISLQLLNADW